VICCSGLKGEGGRLTPVTVVNSSAAILVYRCDHANVVRLLGHSTDGPCRCIVYEFMSNGSLEDRLACRVRTAYVHRL